MKCGPTKVLLRAAVNWMRADAVKSSYLVINVLLDFISAHCKPTTCELITCYQAGQIVFYTDSIESKIYP